MNMRTYFRFILMTTFLAFSFVDCKDPQYSDLQEYGYKGKVKEEVRKYYYLSDEEDKDTNPDESSRFFTATYTFHESGNLKTQVQENNLSGQAKPPIIKTYAHQQGRKSGWKG